MSEDTTPVTIRDVARKAGVAVSTVSRAYTAPSLVRTQTRERVLHVANELGYRPNRAARSLITGRTSNLGVVVPDLGNPFFPSVLKGAQVRAREADHAIFLADSDEDPRLEVELIEAMTKQVDGVIVCSPRMSDSELQRIAGRTYLVLLNRRCVGVSSVLLDGADGARQTIEHLAALGHRRCAFLSGPRRSWSNRARQRVLHASARSSDLELVELGPFSPQFESGRQAADIAIASGVTAIIAFNDLMALGVLNRLGDRGVEVPDEISVIGFDDVPVAAMTTPSLTSVAMPSEVAGRAAVELLLERLTGLDGQVHADQRRLPTQLIVRGSTAPALSSQLIAGKQTAKAR